VAEIKLGNKYDCFNCGTKFYDLGRGTAVCPKCGADQKDASEKGHPAMTQAVRRRRRAELATAPDEVETVAEETDVAAIDEAEEDLAEEDLDLGADEEDEEEDEDEEV
jgi:uncharacterized protein (TIGR02300 family)